MKIEYRRHSYCGATNVEVWDANQKDPLKACKSINHRGYGEQEHFTEKEILAIISRTKNKYPFLKSIIVHIWNLDIE